MDDADARDPSVGSSQGATCGSCSTPSDAGATTTLNQTNDASISCGDDIIELDSVDALFLHALDLPTGNLSTPRAPSDILRKPPTLTQPPTVIDNLRESSSKPPTKTKLGVHRRSRSNSEDSDSDSNEYRVNAIRRRRLNRSGPKANSSWAHHKALKVDAQSAGFIPNDTRLAHFRKKITKDDAHAEFDAKDLRRVRCSACTIWIVMRNLYDVHRWKDHRSSSRCQVQQQRHLVTKSICSFFSSQTVAALSRLSTPSAPCPGLSRENYAKISKYLRRTTTAGGGAPSRTNITKVLFGMDAVYAFLPDTDKQMVLRREELLFKWRNNRAVGAVFSTRCHEEVVLQSVDGRPHPCTECQDLFTLRTFKVNLNRPMPSDNNMKYTPINRRDPDIGEIYLRVKGVRDLVETVCHAC